MSFQYAANLLPGHSRQWETFGITGALAQSWPYQGPHLQGEWDGDVAPKLPSSSKVGKGGRSLRRKISSAMEGLERVMAGVSIVAPLNSVSLGDVGQDCFGCK